MYSLLIVDDETEIREGLARLPWEPMNIEVAGSVAHGLDALQFISTHPIDIVLTDIRMPFMDGMELMTVLQEQHPYIRVVILSGYSDFDYAKKAIEVGAAGYLLKPVKMDQLTETFEKLVRRLDAEKQNEMRRAVLVRKEALLSKFMREELLSRLFKTAIPEDEIEQSLAESELLLESNDYQVAVIRLDRISLNQQPGTDRSLKLIAFSLDNLLHDLWDVHGKGYHLVDKDHAECYLLAKATINREDMLKIHEQLSEFMGLFRSTLSISIGRPVQSINEIWRSAQSAAELLRNTKEENVIVQTGAERLDEDDAAQAAAEAGPRDPSEDRHHDPYIVQLAKQYIRDNYHRSITLKEVAGEMFVTPGHLSWLFRESGESYLQYLTSLRMSKAIELMPDVRYKVYEIAEMVGYSDKTYFSELFKKHTGMTPTEYRGRLS